MQGEGVSYRCRLQNIIFIFAVSVNTDTNYRIIHSQSHTMGINCEKCEPGYYRPKGVGMDDPNPCVKCGCVGLVGSLGVCYTDADHALLVRDGKVS
jgi:laminin alpha 1/2